MREIEIETFMRLGEPAGSTAEKSRHERGHELMRAAMGRCLAALEPGQLQSWKQMIGEPFRGQLSVGLPGVFPPP